MTNNIIIHCKNISKVPLTKKNVLTLIEDLLGALKIKKFNAKQGR